MNKIVIVVVATFSFLVGAVFTAGAFSISAPNLLIKEVISPYDFEKSVRVIRDRINAKEPWEVTEIIDQNQEVINKGAKSIGRVKIIKFCHPNFSSEMLSSDDRKFMASMMPLSIAVYEKSNGEVYISMKNGSVMTKLFGGEIESIAEEVSREIEEIMSFMNFKFAVFR